MRREVRQTARLRKTRRALAGGGTAAMTLWGRRGLAVFGLLVAGAVPAIFEVTASDAAPVGQGFEVTSSDLSHILRQIKIAERHVAVTDAAFLAGPNGIPGDGDDRGMCDALVGNAPDQIGSPLVADGLRTVDGSCNNLVKGNEKFGAEGQTFPRLATPVFKSAEPAPPGFPAQASSSYAQTKGFVYDTQPRVISNLIVDQTSTNPAAVAAAGFPVRTQGNEGVTPCVAANEVQVLSGTPSGEFKLSYEGQMTATLPVGATAAQVRTALVGLSNIGTADVAVNGGPLPAAINITFTGALASQNVSSIVILPATGAITGLTVATPVQGAAAVAAVSEQRTISGTATANYTINFGPEATASLAPTATAADVETALNDLTNLDGVTVTGGPLSDGTALTVTFPASMGDVTEAMSVSSTDTITVDTAVEGVTAVAAIDEQQTATGTPSAVFSIKFGPESTATLPKDASAAQVQAALEALPNVGVGNVSVADGPLPATLTITFQGTLGGQNVAEIEIVPGTSAITGATIATSTPGSSGTVGCVPAHQTLFIPNVTTDVGLSPPFNSLFTIFGQFFDHGVDKTAKGGSGTVFVPLKSDDPLIAGPDHILLDDPDTDANEAADNLPPSKRFMPLSRATNQPGPDGIVGDDPSTPAVDESADDIHDANNTDTPFVDQSQTYTSHPSHQAFLREYSLVAGKPVATGKLINGAKGGQASWTEVKTQAEDLLGVHLTDQDALSIPMIAADFYGNLIPGPNGFAQWVRTDGTTVEGDPAANGGTGVPAPANVKHFQTAFLDDIAHTAVPDKCDPDHDGNADVPKTPDANNTAGNSLDTIDPCQYDDELLGLHFIAGDGRVNENIALTAVHQIFHSEHNRLVDDIQNTLNAPGNEALKAAYEATGPTTFDVGERLFQAARFVTEMEYQHLVFEEFGRKIQPLINPFAGFAFTQANINPAVKAEFAHAVYRFGHSMLTETISRINEDGSTNDIGLLEGFLNPASYFTKADGTPVYANAEQAGGAILMGMSDQTGNEIDEFVTETLRNNLLGLPLDLPTINMTRARSEGIPPLNVFRREIYGITNDSAMQPYTSWIDFGLNLKHPASLVNFVAAYGTDPSITGATTAADKRAAAQVIVDGAETGIPSAVAFMNAPATTSGVDNIDMWVGGLAERTNLFGGLLGNTFNFVFEAQMTDLQNSDRLYYLGRTPGMNLRAQLEGNSFAELVMRNTTAHSLKADAFATADCKFELGSNPGIANLLGGNLVENDPNSECDESKLLIRMADGTIRYRTTNTVDPPGINGQSVYNGTNLVDRIFGGVDNDTFLGNEGNDIIEGGDGADFALGGEGNDRITDNAGDDVLKGGPGNDAIESGPGLDIIMGGNGKDFMNGGANINEIFGGEGDDFMILGQGEDAAQGDGGDDWMEGGDQPDLLQGDSGTLFFTDRNKPGHDVTIGQAGDDDYDVEGGDDIMIADPGIEKSAGAAGWDWYTGSRDPVAQNADLNLKILPPSQTALEVRDRFSEVEALSGGNLNDTLRGDDVVPSQVGGGGFIGCDALDQNGLDRISGLDPIVPPLVIDSAPIKANTTTHECNLSGNVWGEGNILLGGGGADILEGRGADDILDGDRYLDVRLSVRQHGTTTEIGSAKLMESTYQAGNTHTLEQDVMAGVVDPGDIVIVREILSTPGAGDVALFSDVPGAYDVTTNADGSISVAHNRPSAGLRVADGTDTLRNVETLRFCTANDPVTGACTAFTDRPVGTPGPNSPTTGTPTITLGATPLQVGTILTAGNGDIADTDGIALITFNWQMSGLIPGTWTVVGSGPTFTAGPAQQGRSIRVVATVLDDLGASADRISAATDIVQGVPVVPANSPATGTPVVLNGRTGTPLAGRPRVSDPLGVDTTSIADVNGVGPLNFQWQESADGVVFTDIPGATGSTFTPTTTQLGLVLRVRVFFTDLGQGGVSGPSLEILNSAVTRDVRPARGGARALTLAAAAIPRALTTGAVNARGLPVSFTAPKGARVVRITIFRNGSKKVLARTFVTIKAGKVKINLRGLAVRKALGKAGTYRVEITPGASKALLGRTTVRMVTVRTN